MSQIESKIRPGILTPSPQAINTNQNRIRLERWSKTIASFFLGQGLLQIISAVAGFYLLRWMSVENYAMFTLAFGVQSIFVNVVDPGFSMAITPLAGSNASDPKVIARLMAAALSLRKRFFLLGAFGAIGMIAVTGSQHGWSILTITGLSATVVVSLWTLGPFNVSANALVATQKVGTLHFVQNVGAVSRLAGYSAGHLAGVISGISVMGWNTVITIVSGWMMTTKVKTLEVVAPESVIEARKEMWRFVLPLIPLAIYVPVQGQVTILIVSLFGNTTTLAETGALSRLHQLFAPATFLIGWIITPYFSRISDQIAYRRFIQLMGFGLSIAGLSVVFAWFVPGPFLWLLGPNYADLKFEVFLTILSSGVGSCAALAYNLVYARKLIQRQISFIYIIGQVGMQLLLIPWIDLSTTQGAIILGFSASFGGLLISFYIGYTKLKRYSTI